MYARRAVSAQGNTTASGRGGWWGIVFVVGLFVVGALADLPTAAQSGERIVAFYAAHRPTIVAQQAPGTGSARAGSSRPGCSSAPPSWRRTCRRSPSPCWPTPRRRRRTR